MMEQDMEVDNDNFEKEENLVKYNSKLKYLFTLASIILVGLVFVFIYGAFDSKTEVKKEVVNDLLTDEENETKVTIINEISENQTVNNFEKDKLILIHNDNNMFYRLIRFTLNTEFKIKTSLLSENLTTFRPKNPYLNISPSQNIISALNDKNQNLEFKLVWKLNNSHLKLPLNAGLNARSFCFLPDSTGILIAQTNGNKLSKFGFNIKEKKLDFKGEIDLNNISPKSNLLMSDNMTLFFVGSIPEDDTKMNLYKKEDKKDVEMIATISDNPIKKCYLNYGSNMISFASEQKTFKIVKLSEPKAISVKEFSIEGYDKIFNVAFSKDGKRLYALAQKSQEKTPKNSINKSIVRIDFDFDGHLYKIVAEIDLGNGFTNYLSVINE